MPMRLPKERPAKVAAKWPVDTLAEEQSQLGVRFDFFSSPSPSPRLLRALLPYSLPRLRRRFDFFAR